MVPVHQWIPSHPAFFFFWRRAPSWLRFLPRSTLFLPLPINYRPPFPGVIPPNKANPFCLKLPIFFDFYPRSGRLFSDRDTFLFVACSQVAGHFCPFAASGREFLLCNVHRSRTVFTPPQKTKKTTSPPKDFFHCPLGSRPQSAPVEFFFFFKPDRFPDGFFPFLGSLFDRYFLVFFPPAEVGWHHSIAIAHGSRPSFS